MSSRVLRSCQVLLCCHLLDELNPSCSVEYAFSQRAFILPCITVHALNEFEEWSACSIYTNIPSLSYWSSTICWASISWILLLWTQLHHHVIIVRTLAAVISVRAYYFVLSFMKSHGVQEDDRVAALNLGIGYPKIISFFCQCAASSNFMKCAGTEGSNGATPERSAESRV